MKKELIKSIKEKEAQLAQLAEYVDKSEVCSELYNKVVIQKAILKKQLDDMNKNTFAERVVRLFPRKDKKLICDYFHS